MSNSAVWTQAITDFLVMLTAMGAPTSTRTTRAQHLSRCARRIGVGPWEVTGPDLLAYVTAADWSSETRRGHRSSLRVFYAWAAETGRIGDNPALVLPKVPPAPPRPKPTPTAAYTNALAVADRRERLMLRLAAEAGLRRAEVAQVHSRDLFEDLTGWSLVVHGKGGKERLMPLTAGIAVELRALPPGYAFPGRDHGHLSPRWVGTVVARLLPDGHTMHGLRHRFATRSYEVDRDLAVVQELLGHASPATTRRYVAVGRDRLRATVEAAA